MSEGVPVDRFQLIAGPYAPPLFELGDVVTDELRGDVRITVIAMVAYVGRRDVASTRLVWCCSRNLLAL